MSVSMKWCLVGICNVYESKVELVDVHLQFAASVFNDLFLRHKKRVNIWINKFNGMFVVFSGVLVSANALDNLALSV